MERYIKSRNGYSMKVCLLSQNNILLPHHLQMKKLSQFHQQLFSSSPLQKQTQNNHFILIILMLNNPLLMTMMLYHLTNKWINNLSPMNQQMQPSNSPTNKHHMQARSRSGMYKPRAYSVSKEPVSVQEALRHEHWESAMRLTIWPF